MTAQAEIITDDRLTSPLPFRQDRDTQSEEAPLRGSFFDTKPDRQPGDPRLVTPSDEFSGLPLPLYPQELIRSRRFQPDLHHPIHPKRSPELQSVGGKALRNVRVQVAAYETHHYDYHRNFYGPELPKTDDDCLRPVILAAAGYIPDTSIRFKRGKPQIVSLTPRERSTLWEQRRVRIGSARPVQEFLKEYILSQDIAGVNESTIDEFLHTTDDQRRWILGNEFLGRAALQATEQLKPTYRQAFKAELMPNTRAETVSRFVLSQLGMRRQRIRLFEELKLRLVA